MRRCPHTEAGQHRLYYECPRCRREETRKWEALVVGALLVGLTLGLALATGLHSWVQP